jgi:calcineurin-like phosphoesterase family protein
MSTVFVVADTHFGHAGMCKFLREDGTKMRPWDTPEEMDEELVKRWNDTVRPKDKVYHLGDVVINRKALSILTRLNGDKVLIKGNHDIFPLKDYVKHFRDIRAYYVWNRLMCSHIPIHAESKGSFRGNVHGHLHHRALEDPWYFCVCVERTEYRPIALEMISQQFDCGMV